jgi:hypothetical protein
MIEIIIDALVEGEKPPEIVKASYWDASDIPNEGDEVLVLQPDERGVNYVGDAVVTEVDDDHDLILLEVDWNSFRDVIE